LIRPSSIWPSQLLSWPSQTSSEGAAAAAGVEHALVDLAVAVVVLAVADLGLGIAGLLGADGARAVRRADDHAVAGAEALADVAGRAEQAEVLVDLIVAVVVDAITGFAGLSAGHRVAQGRHEGLRVAGLVGHAVLQVEVAAGVDGGAAGAGEGVELVGELRALPEADHVGADVVAPAAHRQVAQVARLGLELLPHGRAHRGIAAVGVRTLLIAVREQEHEVGAAHALGIVGDDALHLGRRAVEGARQGRPAVAAQLLVAGVVLHPVHPLEHVRRAVGARIDQKVGAGAPRGGAVVVRGDLVAGGVQVLGAHVELVAAEAGLATLYLMIPHEPELGVGGRPDDVREGLLRRVQFAAERVVAESVRVGLAAIAATGIALEVVPEHRPRGVEDHQDARAGLGGGRCGHEGGRERKFRDRIPETHRSTPGSARGARFSKQRAVSARVCRRGRGRWGAESGQPRLATGVAAGEWNRQGAGRTRGASGLRLLLELRRDGARLRQIGVGRGLWHDVDRRVGGLESIEQIGLDQPQTGRNEFANRRIRDAVQLAAQRGVRRDRQTTGDCMDLHRGGGVGLDHGGRGGFFVVLLHAEPLLSLHRYLRGIR
jgi:hypothetical protein